ncbi:hypothetical protein R1flu_025015 [Riccia fluitans]|uniref:RecF/RecN/SMC N-terminal domain-containing protein n=1 Tax=Riccia fluitans TaxID=41844 RepID=A0ABD1XXG3_9MARC
MVMGSAVEEPGGHYSPLPDSPGDDCGPEYFDIEKRGWTGKRAGTIRRIHLENFMCHSNLTIEFIDRVNFITGQNGSGKSAILTAILVAFGIKAKGTQRANSIKDFVKNGCRSGAVVIELSNEGIDAYRPNAFGDTIIIERRITDSTSHFTVSNGQGKKIGTKKSDVLDIVEHFNIDVENPCILMTQDKSREFLHAGSEKDKFMFYFKATLQQAVSEKLGQAGDAQATLACIIEESLEALRPLRDQLRQIEEQINHREEVEQVHELIGEYEKKLAWLWVRAAERELLQKEADLEKTKKRIPICQAKIDEAQADVERLRETYSATAAANQQKAQDRDGLMREQASLKRELQTVSDKKSTAQENVLKCRRDIEHHLKQLNTLQQNVKEIQLLALQDTQAEEDMRRKEIEVVEQEMAIAMQDVERFNEEESRLNAEADRLREMIQACEKECKEKVSQIREVERYIRDLSSRQGNTVTAFGGHNVLNLLRLIEENHNRFTRPPLGPLGVYVTLIEEKWSLAVEVALKNLLDAFIVTNQKDMLLLRRLANQANCRNLNICIYDFERRLIRPTENQLPRPDLITIMNTLQSENATVMNVFIDQGSVERLVLAEDYDSGKTVAFSRSTQNVKEVITRDGTRLYSRGGAETTLPKERWMRGGRLGARVNDEIQQSEEQERELREIITTFENRKRALHDDCNRLIRGSNESKRQRISSHRKAQALQFKLQDMKSKAALEKTGETNVDELEYDIAKKLEEIEKLRQLEAELESQLEEAKQQVVDAKERFESLSNSARGNFEACQQAEEELSSLKDQQAKALADVADYEKVMKIKVRDVITSIEQDIVDLQKKVKESVVKASQICPREEVDLADVETQKPEQLSSKILRLRESVRREDRDVDTLDQLRKKRNKVRKRLETKQGVFVGLKRKLDTLAEGLASRKKKFHRNINLQKRELVWKFGRNLQLKGFSGKVNVDYQKQSLTLHVTMPQDESHTSVQDTRALSGGERSYSTLSFALAVHGMIEAPFRAMDEFDIFMDPVSRKISLDVLVKFAKEEGSQWILITPHDISTVESSPELNLFCAARRKLLAWINYKRDTRDAGFYYTGCKSGVLGSQGCQGPAGLLDLSSPVSSRIDHGMRTECIKRPFSVRNSTGV